METITNAASAITSTASNLIYGQPPKENEPTTSNETGGKEPLSGEQGKGTVAEPFDQGNKDTPLATPLASDNTSTQQDDYLKLNPTAAPSAKTDTTTSSTTGATDTAGAGDHAWKPTALDEVKPEGAPGAGPAPPANVTVATPDLSSTTTNKADDTTKDTTPSTTDDTSALKKESSGPPASTEPPKEHSVGGDIDKILESQPKSQHTVDDSEASDPHSKMTGKTMRQTEASQQGESANSKSLATEKTGNSSASHGSGEASDEKVKLSTKEKIKQKLHIGHKDK